MSRTPFAAGLADAFVDDRVHRAPMNESAFLDLYARTAGPLGGYLRRLTRNPAVADDLLQDTYLRFLSQLRVPDDEAHRRNYLFRIATNLARDYFRRERRQEPFDDQPVPSVEPEQHHGDLWAVIGRLSPRDRELLLLAYVEGMTHKEISQVTGLMRASVKPLLFRARRRFAAGLREAGLAAPAALGVSS